jgi:hypothetical protein
MSHVKPWKANEDGQRTVFLECLNIRMCFMLPEGIAHFDSLFGAE